MKKDGYYSSGEFAKMADVTLRTIRYYDQCGFFPNLHRDHPLLRQTESFKTLLCK